MLHHFSLGQRPFGSILYIEKHSRVYIYNILFQLLHIHICKSISLKDFKVYGSLCSCLLLLTNGRLPPNCHHVVVLAFSLRASSGGVACFSSFKNGVPQVGPSTSRRVVSACETNRLQHRCCYLPCMAVSRLARDAHMSRRRPTATRMCPYNPRRFKQ